MISSSEQGRMSTAAQGCHAQRSVRIDYSTENMEYKIAGISN